MVSRVIPVDTFDLVIFGGTGDLSRRKILPGLFRRFVAGQIPNDARIVGAARAEMDDAGFRDFATAAIREFIGEAKRKDEDVQRFVEHLQYVAIDATGENGWPRLAELIRKDAGPQRSGFLSGFFALVGTHGLHVTSGLIWMAVLMVQVARRGLTSTNRTRIMCLSLFWHFLDIVWICVFTVVYLMGAM